MSRRVNILIAFIAAVCLWIPLGARTLGHHADAVENRTLATVPRIETGWNFFKDLGPYINDHLPFRQRAIAADAWADIHLFGEDPSFGGNASPRVIAGSDGFLFINDDFTEVCPARITAAEAAAHLSRLASIIQGSGRRVITAVAPDKSTILPEHLPSDLPLRTCRDEYSSALWNSLRAADIPGWVDLKSLLSDNGGNSNQLLYLRKDTHWNSSGSLIATKRFVTMLRPDLWDDSLVSNDGLVTYEGDLTVLRGLPEKDKAESVSLNRGGVSVVRSEQAPGFIEPTNVRTIRRESGGRLIKGRTLFLIDSFGYAALPQLAPFFEDLTTIGLGQYDPQKFLRLINDADTVLIMSIERSFGPRMLTDFGSDDFLRLLSGSLEGK